MIYSEDMKVPEDINELFPTIDDASNYNLNNKTFDIRKIDLKKLASKLGSFNTTEDDMAMMTNMTMNDARRQVVAYNYAGDWWYKKAMYHMMKQKTTDLMLQNIYMARHIMKELEANPNFSVEDTGYKIGLLYNKLLTIYENMQTIYTMMYNKRLGSGKSLEHVRLHQLSVKLHTQYIYIWKLMIKVDAKYKEKNGQRPFMPKALVATGGITDDERDRKIG